MDETTTAPEVTAEVTPEATPDNDPILAALGEDEPATADTKSEEPAKTEEPAEQEVTEQEEEKSEDTPESNEQPDNSEEKPELDPEEARKEEARKGYEERQKVRQEREQRVKQQTQQYIDEAGDDENEQRLRAIEVQEYSRVIEQTEDKLINEFERVKANPDLAIFNPESDKFNKSLYDKALRDFNLGYIQYDTNGNMVGLKGSLYQHLTETAELYTGAIKSGQFQQVRASRKMKVNSDSKPAVEPKEPVKDMLLDVLRSDD